MVRMHVRKHKDTLHAVSPMNPQTHSSTVSPLAGKPAPKEMLVDLARLERQYYERQPDIEVIAPAPVWSSWNPAAMN